MLRVAFLATWMVIGCSLDRSGSGDDGGVIEADAGARDAAALVDSATGDGGLDCSPGTVDLNGLPDDGCECVVADETCDDSDEDCDGRVDESVVRACGSTVGLCTEGESQCVAGEWSECTGGRGPSKEVCDGVEDESCDGTVDEGCACEPGETRPCGSSVGECSEGTQSCDGRVWGSCGGGVGPTDEVCNGRDDDCDGSIDDGVLRTFYADADGDGRGDPSVTVMACSAPSGFVVTPNDCDDTCDVCWSGASETCDTEDNDCDTRVDEDTGSVFYQDADGDGFGDPGASILACTMPSGYVTNADDCDDDCPTCRPGGIEVCDGRDNDCNSHIDEDTWSVGTVCTCTRVVFDSRAYRFCTVPVNWEGARARCAAAGYRLVSIETDAEQRFLLAETQALSRDWWIGLNDRAREGTFVWADAVPLGVFRPWVPGEPNNGGSDGAENCVEMQPREIAAGVWNDKECDATRPYICESP